jgi:hypothetical protein
MVALYVVHSWGILALCALDTMRAPSRWLLLCLLGQSTLASHTLGLAISWVSCRFETSEGWVLYIQEAHFYHHRVLLTHEAHFIIIRSYSFTRPISAIFGTYSSTKPISAMSGTYSSTRPISINVGTYSFMRPISIIIGSYSFMRPISSSSGLTPSRGPFLSM